MSTSSREINFEFLEVFEPALYSDARYIDIWGGRGRGGSHFVTDLFLFKLLYPKYFRGYFMRAVFGDIRKSLYQDFKDRCEEKEVDLSFLHFNDSEMIITNSRNGNSIHSKGFKKSAGNQTAKLKSIAGATDIVIEECEEVSQEEFDILDVSVRTVKAKLHIFRVWNPPDANHWLIKNYYNLTPITDADGYYAAEPKGKADHLSIFSTYLDNFRNLDRNFVNVLEGYRSTNPDFYYSNVKGYVSSGKKGRIFKEWQLFDVLPEKRLYTVYGLDFGYSPDPSVLVKISINIEHKEIYIEEKFRSTEMSIEEIFTGISKHNEEGHEVICDNAEEREYFALLGYGLNIFRSQKGAGSRGAGRDLLKNFKLFLNRDSADLIEEFQNHTWALDANKLPTGKPVDGWDHGIDAAIYGLRFYIKIYGLL